ncbi:MAG TPA: hypothetical protein VG518_04000 [Solirubrobacterales bacterium]|nr:hypothetical protein [Solirubrobacterales bacterium]
MRDGGPRERRINLTLAAAFAALALLAIAAVIAIVVFSFPAPG